MRWSVAMGLVALAFVASTFRPVIEGDGVGYYSYLHALLVSHSLTFTSEYSAAVDAHVPVYLPLVTTRAPSGGLADFFPVGSALLAAPTYIVALALRPSGEPQFGPPFVIAFALASLFFGVLGLAMSYRLTVAVTANRRAAVLGLVSATLATPYVYYLVSDPSYSHTFSVFCVASFLYLWFAHFPQTPKGWLGLGVVGGLMAMTRFQDVLILAVLATDVRRLRPSALLLVPGVLLGFAPQLLADHAQFGQWLPERPPGQDLNPLQLHLFDTLFSSRDGLFFWTPATALVLVSFFFVRDRRFQVAMAIAVVLETAAISAAPDAVGRSFGARRFLDLLPFAVVGFAALDERIGPRIGWALVGVLAAWNIVLEANFEYLMGSFPRAGYGHVLAGQLTAIGYVPRLFAKGAVVRDLVLWRQAHQGFDPVEGATLLFLQAGSIAGGLALAAARPWRPNGVRSLSARRS